MLLSVDTNALGRYLNPSKAKLISKGVKSVPARVLNLCELRPSLTREQLNDALIGEFRATYPELASSIDVEEWSTDSLPADVAKRADALRSWDWRFGQTPNFEYNLEVSLFGVLSLTVFFDGFSLFCVFDWLLIIVIVRLDSTGAASMSTLTAHTV